MRLRRLRGIKGCTSGGFYDKTEMTRKKAKNTTRIVHARWTEHKMTLHLKDYCNDAKRQYLDADSYKKATARLTTRTGWKI